MPDFIDKIDLSGTYIPLNDDRMNTDIYSVFKGKNLLCFGDSWATGYLSTTNAPPGATEQNSRFSYVVSTAFNMNEMNYASSGSGFDRPGNKILTQVTTALAAMSNQEKTDTKIALIIGGVNDLKNIASETLSDVLNEIQNVINTITNDCPNCYVVFGVDIPENLVSVEMHDWLNQMAEKSQMLTNRVQYLNISEVMSSRLDLYNSDRLHPNYTGHQVLAGMIISALLGSTSPTIRYMGKPTLETGYTIHDDKGLDIFKFGPFMVMTPGQIDIASAQQQTGYRKIGDMQRGCGASDVDVLSSVFKNAAISGSLYLRDSRIFLNTTAADSTAITQCILWLPLY